MFRMICWLIRFRVLCPFHGDCLEGLASGPALEERWGKPGEDLPEDHPAWELEAHYLALGLANIFCVLSPQRFILGGGVMEQARLLPLIRKNVQQLLNNYVQHPAVLEQIDDYIVLAPIGPESRCTRRACSRAGNRLYPSEIIPGMFAGLRVYFLDTLSKPDCIGEDWRRSLWQSMHIRRT